MEELSPQQVYKFSSTVTDEIQNQVKNIIKESEEQSYKSNHNGKYREKDSLYEIVVNQNGALESSRLRHQRISRKLNQWIIFSVAAALSPIGINILRAAGNGETIGYSIISHGELVLVCAALAAEAIGDLIKSGKTKGSVNMYSLGTCLMVFFLSSGLFVIAESEPRKADLIAISSLVMFVLTLIAGGVCKVLAEG